MDVCWVIERYLYSEEQEQALIKEVKAQGSQVILLDALKNGDPMLNDFSRAIWQLDKPVVFKGSLNLARKIQSETLWSPGVIYTNKNFNCSTYYAYWGEWMLNRNYRLVPFREALRLTEEWTEIVDNLHRFVRPDSGDKTFNGGVYTYDEMINLAVEYNISPTTLVLTAPVKTIYAEYRFVVSDRKILSSNYNKTDESYTAQDYLRYILAKVSWEPDEIYVVDIAECVSGFAVLELNSFSCSDLYSCDVKPIVTRVNDIALEKYHTST